MTRLFSPGGSIKALRHGTGNGAEGVADLRAKQAYDSNHNEGNRRKDDRILHQAPDLFLWARIT